MSISQRNTGRLHSPFTEVRGAAREQVLMTVASATGLISVATVVVTVVLSSSWI
ncbi:hypothetical protein L1277_001579 [Okibacterium sp. HSC-33S16]|uniref:hypothetical protein n=1 Tax=Okibacterium sp. HSC-33S16 TaxID=2910965 RepID=UPI00209D20CE|nr:hypothetical protein [Okibacterium sp. HSC-33S16]MCP2031488.1 hypothetical protein [Okibacterium sp. HSC-33S16]